MQTYLTILTIPAKAFFIVVGIVAAAVAFYTVGAEWENLIEECKERERRQ